MRKQPLLMSSALVLILLFVAACAQAQYGSIYLYNVGNYEDMPVKALYSKTIIEGPLARTHSHYVIGNKYKDRIEVGLNLEVPEDTILVGFSYYYQNRLIKGKMYDKDEAWKIYKAVTSKGRDPGVMDRPSAQSYHAQIFPVEPGNDLKVEIDLIQVVGSDKDGLFFELPSSMRDGEKTVYLQARVEWQGASIGKISDSFKGKTERSQEGDTAIVRIAGDTKPQGNWRITMKRPTDGFYTSIYSGMTSPTRGYYAMLISPPRSMVSPRLELINRLGTSLSMPTAFDDISAKSRVFVVGRYKLPGKTQVVLRDKKGRRYSFDAELSSQKLAYNPAAPLWADKRITQLQNNYSRDWRSQIISLSMTYNVISDYTALLAIPQEELERYKQMLAKKQINTNTDYTRGGDPWINVKAPADAQQVVAVFPNGEAKSLTYDQKKECWAGRFDIPFGTAEGEYRVTVIVVHKDGKRTRFILTYENRLSSTITAGAKSLTASPGEDVAVKVTGTGIRRAVALAPWGERVTLSDTAGTWQGAVTIPKDWGRGESRITVILLDGAHNRTEISVDLQVK